MARLRAWMRDEDGRRNENGNSFALFIVLLPIILGCFGMGVDLSRNVMVKAALQGAVDTAVASGIAENEAGPNGAPIINAYEAEITTLGYYAHNRNQAVGGLHCQSSGANLVIGPGNRSHPVCWTQPRAFRAVTQQQINSTTGERTDPQVTFYVTEYSRNNFLPILFGYVGGVGNPLAYQRYNLQSTAILKQRACGVNAPVGSC